MKNKNKIILQLILYVCFCLVIAVFGCGKSYAEEEHYDSTGETAYLRLSVEKYGKTYTSSSDSVSVPTIDVLEYTEWQLHATYVVIEKGKIKSSRDVTNQCTWKSTDGSGQTVSVSNGKVIAGYDNGYKYTVSASYEGITIGQYSSNVRTYSAKMLFHVKKLTVTDGNLSLVKGILFSAFAEEEWNSVSVNWGKTIAEILHQKWEAAAGNSGAVIGASSRLSDYLQYKSVADKNSATMMNAYSGVLGNTTVKDSSAGNYFKEAVFADGSETYIVFVYTGSALDISNFSEGASYLNSVKYKALFEEAAFAFKACTGDLTDCSNITVVGYGVGGLAANYLSCVRGCKSVSIHSPSAVSYARELEFAEFCHFYNQQNQTVINSTNSLTTRAGKWVSVTENTCSKNTFGNFFKYNKSQESIRIVVEGSTGETKVHSAYGDAYYGTSVGDTYDFPYASSPGYIFGGNGSDYIIIDGTIDYVAFAKTSLDIYTLTKSILKALEQNKTIREFIKEELIDRIKEAILQTQCQAINDLTFDENSDPYEYLDMVLSIAASTKTITLLEAIDLPGLALDWIDSRVNKYIIGGKGNDKIIGSWDDDAYCYYNGDGLDTIDDGMGHDSVYLMGFDSGCTLTLNEEEGRLQVFVNGTLIMSIKDVGCGDITFYQGSPFDSPKQIALHGRNWLDKISLKIKYLRTYHFACPVDVVVLNENGETAYYLKDGTESDVRNEDGIFTVENENGEYVKNITLTNDAWTVRAVGTGEGTMDYQFRIYDVESETTQSVALFDIPVREGEVFAPTDALDHIVLCADLDADGINDIEYDKSRETVSFQQSQYSIEYGQKFNLFSELVKEGLDHSGTWTSLDESIVFVDQEGNIIGIGTGTTVVSYLTEDGCGAQVSVTVTESAMTADQFTVTGLQESYAYTGEEIRPEVEVRYGAIELIKDTDYTVDYQANTEPGTAQIILSGIGKYTQTKTVEFVISEPQIITTVDAKVKQIVGECREYEFSTEYETALWLHDWLIENAAYDFSYTYYDPSGVLLKSTGVCQSYAEAYQLLLNEMGIQNEVVYAPEMDHAWNIVFMDGQWCHVDCTWDDPGTGGAENHGYFGLNDELMSRDHQWDQSKYTACSSLDNFYYKREGYHCVSDETELADVLNAECSGKSDSIFLCYIGTDADFVLSGKVNDWISRNSWKYGLLVTSGMSSGYILVVGAEYTDPWPQPAEFTGMAPCPEFTLHGPEGTYRLSDYQNNGIILIFGREGCFNTRGLLDSLADRLSSLREAGVEVIINEVDATEADDFGYLYETYPDFVYTYGDYRLLDELEEAVGADYAFFPMVFFINKNEMITFSSGGYVYDIDGFIENALSIQTDTPLPAPGAAESGYRGNYFIYTGEKNDSLITAVRDQLNEKRSSIWVYDETDGAYNEDGENVYWVLMQIVEELRENSCDFETNYSWYYSSSDSHFRGIGVVYDVHTVVEDPAAEPTCTEKGCTAGTHCSVCGKILTAQEELSALGHNMTYTEQDNGKGYYHCEDCNKDFWDLCGNEEKVRNGFASEDGVVRYYRDGVPALDVNGLVNDPESGNWYYLKDGAEDISYTGLVPYNDAWFYVSQGVLDWSYTGLVLYNDTWFYVNSGVVDWSYAGLASHNEALFYISGGVLDWNYTGLTCYNDIWYYVSGGCQDQNYTGLICYNDSWFYISEGELDWGYTGLTFYHDTFYYVSGGALDWNYTGLACHNEIWYYVSSGSFDQNYTSLVFYQNAWYYVSNGELDWSYTGLTCYNGTWYYVSNGELDWSYTGLTCYNGTWYYVSNGVLDWSYTGLTCYNGTWYYVSNGELDWRYTGLTCYNGTWYYVSNGVLDWDYIGLVLYEDVWHYVSGGSFDQNYTGLVYYNDAWFYVEEGILSWDYTGLTYYNGAWFYVSGSMIDWGYSGEYDWNGSLYTIVSGVAAV